MTFSGHAMRRNGTENLSLTRSIEGKRVRGRRTCQDGKAWKFMIVGALAYAGTREASET